MSNPTTPKCNALSRTLEAQKAQQTPLLTQRTSRRTHRELPTRRTTTRRATENPPQNFSRYPQETTDNADEQTPENWILTPGMDSPTYDLPTPCSSLHHRSLSYMWDLHRLTGPWRMWFDPSCTPTLCLTYLSSTGSTKQAPRPLRLGPHTEVPLPPPAASRSRIQKDKGQDYNPYHGPPENSRRILASITSSATNQ